MAKAVDAGSSDQSIGSQNLKRKKKTLLHFFVLLKIFFSNQDEFHCERNAEVRPSPACLVRLVSGPGPVLPVQRSWGRHEQNHLVSAPHRRHRLQHPLQLGRGGLATWEEAKEALLTCLDIGSVRDENWAALKNLKKGSKDILELAGEAEKLTK